MLFDLSTVRMVEAKVLLPAASTLERLISSVKERAAIQLWRALGAIPDEETKERLLTLLAVPPGRRRQSALDRLRKAPTSPSINGLVGALRRLEEIETLGARRFDLGRTPQGRLDAMARHVAKAKAAEIERMPAERRMAHLVAYTATLEGNAIDDVLTILDDVVGGLLSKVERKGKRRRLRTLGDLDRAALALREAWFELKAAAEDPEADLRATVMRLAVEHVDQAAATVAELARPPDDRYFEDLPSRYSHVRRFLPHLLRLVTFEGTDAAKPVLAAWDFLRRQEVERPKPRWVDAPLEVASGVWRPIVEPKPGQIDHRAYTLCALERLRDAMRKRDVFVKASRRWRDPREQLLAGDEWEAARSGVCRSLGRSADGEAELALLAEELDLAWRRTAEDLPTNTALAIEERYGRAYVRLTPLEAAPQPASFVALEKAVAALMPKVDLPDVILEVASWTGFPDEFTHVSEGEARVDDLWITVCAVLLAEACNVGLEPLARKKVPALTRSRLAFVAQNYFRAETETRANTRFVNFQATMALARQWGGGDVASVDGLRFIVPVRTINAGPNPHYFHYGAGVTLYSFVSNQFTGFHHMVIRGTDRDSFYILGGPIDNVTSLSPVQFISDTAGSSEIIYGLFWLMGFLYSPREADLNEARFWRLDRNADYGVLNDLARNRANGKVIVDNWDDLIRVAGSLKTGKVQPMDLIRSLRSGSRLTSLGAALAELGRLPKTLHNLAFIAKDETYRRGILTALNHGESRNKLARRVFHGQKGELRQRYREGQEDQLGALGLVVNIIVLWNTRYMEAALDHLRATGFDVREEDVRRLTPLIWEHIELHGRYAFPEDQLPTGTLRPLRDPTVPEEPDL